MDEEKYKKCDKCEGVYLKGNFVHIGALAYCSKCVAEILESESCNGDGDNDEHNGRNI